MTENQKKKDFIIGTPRANCGKRFFIFGTGSSGDRLCYVFSKIKYSIEVYFLFKLLLVREIQKFKW